MLATAPNWRPARAGTGDPRSKPARRWLVALTLLLALAIPAAQAEESFRIRISEPYLDLHTGPGRGYPVFDVLERGETASVLQRRTDWYLLDGERVQGWAHRDQLALNRSVHGEPLALPEGGRAAYLARRFEVGFGAGAMDGDAALALRGGYRLGDGFSAELGLTHVPGTYSSSRNLSLNLVASPLEHWRLEPTVTVGVGYFENAARPTLVDGDDTSGRSLNAGLGVRGLIDRNLVLRADLRRHSVSLDRGDVWLTEITAGFTAFF